jgi:hypothetical protein
MSQKIRCANRKCRRLFVPNPRAKNHQYCDREACQRVRRSRWQRQKIKSDPEYRKDQQESQQCWAEQNRDYWQRYREQHPRYAERNRLLQKDRDQRRQSGHLAKMDALNPESHVIAGSYYLIPGTGDLAKMDALSPKYILIPVG